MTIVDRQHPKTDHLISCMAEIAHKHKRLDAMNRKRLCDYAGVSVSLLNRYNGSFAAMLDQRGQIIAHKIAETTKLYLGFSEDVLYRKLLEIIRKNFLIFQTELDIQSANLLILIYRSIAKNERNPKYKEKHPEEIERVTGCFFMEYLELIEIVHDNNQLIREEEMEKIAKAIAVFAINRNLH